MVASHRLSVYPFGMTVRQIPASRGGGGILSEAARCTSPRSMLVLLLLLCPASCYDSSLGLNGGSGGPGSGDRCNTRPAAHEVLMYMTVKLAPWGVSGRLCLF